MSGRQNKNKQYSSWLPEMHCFPTGWRIVFRFRFSTGGLCIRVSSKCNICLLPHVMKCRAACTTMCPLSWLSLPIVWTWSEVT